MAQLDRFKLTAISWDSDKEPHKFSSWVETFSSLVRSTEHGTYLEDFLDQKLDRQISQPMAIPSYLLNDDDFSSPSPSRHSRDLGSDEDETAPSVDNDGPPSAAKSGRTAFSLQRSTIKYRDMPEGARTLDALLYNILRINVKGAKNALLSCVAFPSYVQAMTVLVKHMDISRNDRKTKAFEQADKLTFDGDVHSYQIKAIHMVKELFDAKCSIMDFALTKIMKSFNGRCKSVQFDIAKDINTREINDQTNVFDMIQGYCADIASVGDTRAEVNAIGDQCTYCHKSGHTISNCFKKQREESPDPSSAQII